MTTSSEEDWGPRKDARVWRHAGDVLAVPQSCRMSGGVAPRAAARPEDVSRGEASRLGFYYISGSALRLLGGR
ncbi:hypothetical protein [Streptomyces sp. NPDC001068]|uniref:hypothetical protein n=1 Tax=Streptomyces sp. NPDC001068 TaxID=3364544 RepID=UPI0036BB79D0